MLRTVTPNNETDSVDKHAQLRNLDEGVFDKY